MSIEELKNEIYEILVITFDDPTDGEGDVHNPALNRILELIKQYSLQVADKAFDEGFETGRSADFCYSGDDKQKDKETYLKQTFGI